MIRGTTHFSCDNCGNMFQAPDFEYAATVLSVPQKCPQCGSTHTYPFTFLGVLNKCMYTKIWRKIDKKNKT